MASSVDCSGPVSMLEIGQQLTARSPVFGLPRGAASSLAGSWEVTPWGS